MITPIDPIDRRTCLTRVARAAAGLCAIPAAALAHRSTAQTSAPEPATARPASRFATVDGVRLHYLDWGSGGRQRPALVLLHPGPLNARAWSGFGTAMSPFFHVIAPDARGHGESEWKRPYETGTLLADVHGLLTGLGLRELMLCGNSMGGTLAIAYAARYPGSVTRLVSVDTGATPPEGAASAPAGRPPLPPPLPEGPFASVEDAAARIHPVMGAGFIQAMVTLNLTQRQDGRWHWKHDYAGMVEAGPRAMSDPGRWSRWQAVSCPTLLLRGERSLALSAVTAERMVAARRDTTLQVVPDAGHFIALEQPAAFERIVRGWLGV